MAQDFPSIVPLLYEEKDFLELYHEFIELLRSQDEIKYTLAANKLEQCMRISTDPVRLHELEQIFVDLKKQIANWQETHDFPFNISIYKRRKNLIGTIEKIVLCQEKSTLNEVNDILGFRILIDNGIQDTEESIEATYKICEVVYEYFTKKKCFVPFSFCKVPKKNEYDGTDKHIMVPKESKIPKTLLDAHIIKDYVAFTKKNGYQSIHMVFTDADGNCFEIQIRTQAMHIHAEYGSANHDEYKNARYDRSAPDGAYQIHFDPLKVKIKGYIAFKDANGEMIVSDTIGLDNSIDPFNLLYKSYRRIEEDKKEENES